jgi:hypothetical protein
MNSNTSVARHISSFLHVADQAWTENASFLDANESQYLLKVLFHQWADQIHDAVNGGHVDRRPLDWHELGYISCL